MTQLAPVTLQDQMHNRFTRFMAASGRMTQGLISFQIASAKLTREFWIDAFREAADMAFRSSSPTGMDGSLKAAKARCDRAVQEMRAISDRVLACSFECAETALEGAAQPPLANPAPEGPVTLHHRREAAE